MIEVWDIGNTHTRIALWDGGEFIDLRRFPAGEIPDITGNFHRVAACVNPVVRAKLPECGIKFITAADKNLPVDFSLVDTSTLGADRVANAVAAATLYPLPAVVIDCGTALTMEVIDDRKCFAGGAIAPGRILLRKALATGTAQLPDIPLTPEMPEEIGRNTVGAIRFGVDAGIVGTIRQWLEVVQKKYPDLHLILTGGDAGFLAPQFPDAIVVDEYFTLHGIRIAGEKIIENL